MPIDKEQVKHIAELAQLELTEEEIEKYSHELSSIIEYIDKLKQVQTVKAVNYIHDPKAEVEHLPLREDEPKPSFPKAEVLKNVPEKEKDYIKVPRIVE